VATEWTIADAWVFPAISGTSADDPTTLTRIIARADGINHAILTETEFTHAVPRLATAGLISADAQADRYWRTEAGHHVYRKHTKRRGLFGWTDAIPTALRKVGEPCDAPWALPAGTFDRAADNYLKRARAIQDRGRPYQDPGRHGLAIGVAG
jgi:hypothetical protein